MNIGIMKLLIIFICKTNSLLLIILTSFIIATLANSEFHESNWYCQEKVGNYTKNSTYQNNLNALFPQLINQALDTSFGNSSIGEGIDKVYMLYNCRGDLNLQQCHECIKEAAQSIVKRCPFEKESIIWYEECTLRYANRSIFSLEEESDLSWDYGPGTDNNPELPKIVSENINGLIMQAAYNKSTGGYVTGQDNISPYDELYFLVQCTPDILGSRCERCLRAAFRSMAGCCGKMNRISLRIFLPSCHIRYDPTSVTKNASPNTPSSPSLLFPPPPPNTGASTTRMLKSNWDISTFGRVMVVGGILIITPAFT